MSMEMKMKVEKLAKPLTLAMVAISANICTAGDVSPLKVLMVGNSYSLSVMDRIPAVAKSCGCQLDICNMYIGGCPMERHVGNIAKSEANPEARQYGIRSSWAFGEKPDFPKSANIPEMLSIEKWDIVTVQQASPHSFRLESYHPYGDKLVETIRKYAPQAEIVVQETWSDFPETPRLKKWSLTSQEMYKQLHWCYGDFAKRYGFRVIPTGTAVEFTRGKVNVQSGSDPHLNAKGKYLQALVWVSKLFGVDVSKCEYVPDGIGEDEASVLKDAATRAVNGELPEYAEPLPPRRRFAVFGGSFSCIGASQVAKDGWRRGLFCTVKDYGKGGCGFIAGEGQGNDVPSQVGHALESGENYDIYVLWASTNDVKFDNVDKQNERIEAAVAAIRAKDPKARIAFFTSMPVPLKPDMNEGLGRLVAGQIATCGKLGVPCLDLYSKSGVTAENAAQFTTSDKLHPNKAGYENVKDMQTEFLRGLLSER